MKKLVLSGLMTALGCLLAAPAAGDKPSLDMLDQLEGGSWEVRIRGETGAARNLCIDSGRAFLQLRHPNLPCNTLIIDDTTNEVTVQYTCKGQGYGRTHVRRETNRLVQIDSQGIAKGVPFSFAAEARRAGNCHN